MAYIISAPKYNKVQRSPPTLNELKPPLNSPRHQQLNGPTGGRVPRTPDSAGHGVTSQREAGNANESVSPCDVTVFVFWFGFLASHSWLLVQAGVYNQ